jgi:hypothetical protein
MATSRYNAVISLLLLMSMWSQLAIPFAFADEVAVDTPQETTAPASTESTSEPSAPEGASASAASGSESSESSTNTETHEESASSQSETTASGSSATDALETTAEQSESHDDLEVHATITGSLDTGGMSSSTADDFLSIIPISSSTVMESVNNIASTTENGFLGLDFTVPSVGSTTSTSTPQNTDNASSTQSGSNPPLSCAATENAVEGSDDSLDIPNPTIRSGSAIVLANILNLLNTTFINSPGGILFSNFTEEAPTIDLRDASLLTSCEESACDGQEGLEVNIVGDATIDNEILLDAMSGMNDVSHPVEGNATTNAIQTGDAIAGLNLVNIANTTFINSQYLIVTLNAFEGVNGDIVFPSLLNFFASAGGSSLASGSTITNAATVANDVAASADSGSNTTEGSDMSVISTGTADAHTNVFNQINSILPNSQISILFRISGTWNGTIFGMPSGVSQVRGPDGSVYIFGNPEEQASHESHAPLLNSTTTADINNRVQLGALSGQNAIENASTSIIATGDALASANIINIANQNVIGRNWILAIIDIFGDFTGNIAFGRPDLWIGDRVDAPGIVQNGSTLTYTITVINNGDSPANNVVVKEMPALQRLTILDMSLPQDPCVTDAIAWNLGTLQPGDAVEVTYTAQVKGTSQGDRITNTSTVSATETDNNLEDNTDSTTVTATVFSIGGGGSGCGSCLSSQSSGAGGGSEALSTSTLQVTRVTADVTLEGTSTVPQRIVIKNTTDRPIRDVVFHDYLRDPTTQLVHEERWNLDTVAPHEEITIQYSVVFEPGAMSGTYRLTTELEGKNYPSTLMANGAILVKATPQLLSVSLTDVPKIRVINRGAVQDGPILIKATSTLPGIPQTAAVAAADSGVTERYVYLILFLLLFAASYGALRILPPKIK